MTMVPLDHRREELPHHPEMRDSVDLERLLDNLLRAVEDRKPSTNPSIVDQDSGMTMLPADLSCSRSNLFRARDIALIEMYPRCFIHIISTPFS
jgi:hypothetical protein